MQLPSIPNNESERLSSVYQYENLFDEKNEELQTIVELAASICDTPVSLVTFVEENKQFFKARKGLPLTHTSRDHSFCAHAINQPSKPFIVEDAREDKRFFDNPLVTGDTAVVFYGGVPLVNQDNHPLGTLCVIDHRERKLTDFQINSLQLLSKQVTLMLDYQRSMDDLEKSKQLLEDTVNDLDHVAAMIAHDLKSACRRISITTEILQMKHEDNFDEESQGLLKNIIEETEDASQFTDDILKLSKSLYSYKAKLDKIDISKMVHGLVKKMNIPPNFKIEYPKTSTLVKAPSVAVGHIFENLMRNSVKYMDNENPVISIKFWTAKSYHYFEITDNGPGIPEKYQASIFEAFDRGKFNREERSDSSGIGLAIVKKLVYFLGGSIEMFSKEGEGTTFRWQLPILV
jgi:signal transduction histidine kinase